MANRWMLAWLNAQEKLERQRKKAKLAAKKKLSFAQDEDEAEEGDEEVRGRFCFLLCVQHELESSISMGSLY